VRTPWPPLSLKVDVLPPYPAIGSAAGVFERTFGPSVVPPPIAMRGAEQLSGSISHHEKMDASGQLVGPPPRRSCWPPVALDHLRDPAAIGRAADRMNRAETTLDCAHDAETAARVAPVRRRGALGGGGAGGRRAPRPRSRQPRRPCRVVPRRPPTRNPLRLPRPQWTVVGPPLPRPDEDTPSCAPSPIGACTSTSPSPDPA
jgi:hypothetical protein